MSHLSRAAAVTTFALSLLALPPHADAQRMITLFGGIRGETPLVETVGSTRIEVLSTGASTIGDGSFYRIAVPEGPQTLLLTGGPCTQPTENPVDAVGRPGHPFDPDSQNFNPIIRGIVPDDASINYRCDNFRPNFPPPFTQNLRKKVAVTPTKLGIITFNKPLVFDGRSYRKLYVGANGWFSFSPVIASRIPACGQFSAANVPPNSVFASAGCATTKSVAWDVFNTNQIRIRWQLVDPATSQTTDIEVLLDGAKPNRVAISYGAVGGAHDGSDAFIGLSNFAGHVFTIGDHEPTIAPNTSIQLTSRN